jgi:CRP-like cAMP-binding protein
MILDNRNTPCLECFNGKGLFHLFKDSEKELFKKNILEVRFKKGEVIFKQSTYASNIVFLKEGLVKLYLEFQDRNLILQIEPANQLLGLQALCGNNLFRNTCVAYENSTVQMLDLNFFKQLISENAAFGTQVINTLTESSIANYDHLICLTQKKTHERLADILLCLFYRIYKFILKN